MRKTHVVVFALAALVLQTSAKDALAWRYRWPGVIPEVAERTLEPTKRVVLDEKVCVEVSCAEDPDAAADPELHPQKRLLCILSAPL